MAKVKFPQNDGKNFIIHDGKKKLPLYIYRGRNVVLISISNFYYKINFTLCLHRNRYGLFNILMIKIFSIPRHKTLVRPERLDFAGPLVARTVCLPRSLPALRFRGKWPQWPPYRGSQVGRFLHGAPELSLSRLLPSTTI